MCHLKKTLAAEIGLLHARIGQESLCRVLHNHIAHLEHVAAARELQGSAGVLLHKEDGHALFADAAYGAEDTLYEKRGKTKGRLVKEQEPRLGHEGPAHGQHLLSPPESVPAICERRSRRRGKS